MNRKEIQEEKHICKTIMVTDLMKRTDKEAIELLQYFEKNFDVKLNEIKEKYEKR